MARFGRSRARKRMSTVLAVMPASAWRGCRRDRPAPVVVAARAAPGAPAGKARQRQPLSSGQRRAAPVLATPVRRSAPVISLYAAARADRAGRRRGALPRARRDVCDPAFEAGRTSIHQQMVGAYLRPGEGERSARWQ